VGLWGSAHCCDCHQWLLSNREESIIKRSSIEGAGKVYLVGAGPGDPDLLTVKALRTLGRAGVVLHDALVSAEVLALISPQARIINVGKRCGQKKVTQDEINQLLVDYAMAGEVVVRLKSGDPLIFGRAGEELDALQRAGIEAEIIPGVTAAVAAAASLRVSLTDRRKADQLLLVSAHRGIGKEDNEPDWHTPVNSRTTVVVYMPGHCAAVGEDLRRAGLNGSTPCAVASKVSTPEEQWFRTKLDLLDRLPRMDSPCVLIAGETLISARSQKPRAKDTFDGESSNHIQLLFSLDDWSPA
jgi:uroporphyrin-III C-methyltransferase